MQKLYSMEKVLGDGKGQSGSTSNADEFNTIKLTVSETLVTIRKKLDEKDAKVARFNTNPETLKLGTEIKEKLQTLDKQLGQMNEVLRKQKRDRKRYGVSELEIKEKQYNTFLTQMKELKARERGVQNDPNAQMKTLVEMKSDLMAKGTNSSQRTADREMTADEEAAIDRWKEGGKEQDKYLDDINKGLSTLKGKALNIGEQVDKQTNLINNLEEQIDVAYTELESSNTKLKKVLVEYRKPGRFCMDVTLILVLLGLIGIIIKLA